ncbi:type II secretion system protein N [Pseudomonas borbori]
MTPLPLLATQRWIKLHATSLVAIALILAMSISLAWQTANWLRVLRAPTVADEQGLQQQPEVAAYQNLDQLFGSSSQSSDGAAPATQMNLTLLGSFVHADPARSTAIIRREGSDPQRYGIDAEVTGGVRLSAVFTDRVELMRNGRRESLAFPQRQASDDSMIYVPADETRSSVEELDEMEAEDMSLLRERMDALRQQMEASGTLPTDVEPTDQPTESD